VVLIIASVRAIVAETGGNCTTADDGLLVTNVGEYFSGGQPAGMQMTWDDPYYMSPNAEADVSWYALDGNGHVVASHQTGWFNDHGTNGNNQFVIVVNGPASWTSIYAKVFFSDPGEPAATGWGDMSSC